MFLTINANYSALLNTLWIKNDKQTRHGIGKTRKNETTYFWISIISSSKWELSIAILDRRPRPLHCLVNTSALASGMRCISATRFARGLSRSQRVQDGATDVFAARNLQTCSIPFSDLRVNQHLRPSASFCMMSPSNFKGLQPNVGGSR